MHILIATNMTLKLRPFIKSTKKSKSKGVTLLVDECRVELKNL